MKNPARPSKNLSLYSRLVGRSLVYPARTMPKRTPPDVGISDFSSVTFPSADGLNLYGWYIPPTNGSLLIFLHGHGRNRGELLDEASIVSACGYGVLLFDLRNHGESEGDRTTMGLTEVVDVKGAADFVRAQPNVDPDKIALFGHSMGAATAILAAAQMPEIAAVIAASAFASVEENIAQGVKGATGLPPFPFAPLAIFFARREAGMDIRIVRPVNTIGQISPRPVFIINGGRDKVITARTARRLYEAAGDPKELFILPDAGHYGFLAAEPTEYPRRIIAFLDRHLSNRSDSSRFA